MTPENESARRPDRALPSTHQAIGCKTLTPDADTLKRRLVDPQTVLGALGLLDGAKRQAAGYMIRCPWHPERTPSCSVRVGADGTLAAHCFGCGAGGNVFSLVGAASGLDVHRDFAAVLERAAVFLRRSAPIVHRQQKHATEYPSDAAEIWGCCGKVCDDVALCEQLRARGLDAAAIADLNLGRTLPIGRLPRWCCAWARLHRLVVPLYDCRGNLRSLHARTLAEQLPEGQTKGRFPTGFSTRGLVMADDTARDVLATGTAPWWNGEVIIGEGATDFLALASRWGEAAERTPATFGIFAGGWSDAIAARIPSRAVVRVATDPDATGLRFAEQLDRTLLHCRVVRVSLPEVCHGPR